MTLIGSEQRICLPMPSKKLRDKMLRRFQCFLGTFGGRSLETPLGPRVDSWQPVASIKLFFGK